MIDSDTAGRLDGAIGKVGELVAELSAADELIDELVAENEELRHQLDHGSTVREPRSTAPRRRATRGAPQRRHR